MALSGHCKLVDAHALREATEKLERPAGPSDHSGSWSGAGQMKLWYCKGSGFGLSVFCDGLGFFAGPSSMIQCPRSPVSRYHSSGSVTSRVGIALSFFVLKRGFRFLPIRKFRPAFHRWDRCLVTSRAPQPPPGKRRGGSSTQSCTRSL
jgi:hypothetical protein